ncbi:MAG: UDP-N-acetylmuramoyl-L-alanyl-D-glutamate--2,6-diaminopimelate ligase [Actinomycetota bacterium]|nr:UDP-N-acetylmuramoyl-L-alanyl-D-glutamate--2,6-diaminopimelate ligase [Actinomycetota bacterium]
MELREVLEAAHAEIEGDPATEVAGLALDNRKVDKGTLFFCVPGATADGHDFAPAAIDAGASAIVVERRLGLGVAEALVPDSRAAMAPAALRFFGDPTRELSVAGITGTNGKTTTAFLLRHILEHTGIQTGLLGTVKSVIGGVEAEVERTTPEAIDLQATFRAMLDAGDRACAMEVSSHALILGRSRGISFSVGVFTNLTQDHLDFHSGMEDYFAAKRLLFEGPDRPSIAVVNIDDPYGARLAEDVAGDYSEGLVTFSASDASATVRAMDVEFDVTGSRFRVEGPWGEARVEMPLPGDFNVQNALAALGAATALGADPLKAAQALADVGGVPGRMEPIDAGQPFAVLVDYAHTPDSLDNVLRAARRLTPEPGRVICVFGCGGDRDRDKRPIMGAIAARLADVGVVTSDNPRSEEPASIVAEIRAGMERDDVVVEVDRRAAIRLALELASAGDTVVIAGKGHEHGQEFKGGRKIPFDDREVARSELAGIGESR